MEPRQTAHGRQRPCGVPGHVPGSGFGDQLQGEGGKLELLLQPARALVERRGLDVGGELGQVGIRLLYTSGLCLARHRVGPGLLLVIAAVGGGGGGYRRVPLPQTDGQHP